MGWQNDARAAAAKYGINPGIFVALVRQESGGNQNARSGAGAIGRTQLMPATAKSLGVDPNNAQQNLDGGAKYLKQQLDHFDGSYHKALAAYNAGPGAVEKYGGIPPYAETENYVKSILGNAKTTGSSSPRSSSIASSTTTKTIPGVDNSKARAQAFLGYLGDDAAQHSDTGFLNLASTLSGLKDTPAKTVTSPSVGSTGSSSGTTSPSAVLGRAKAIDSQHLPYSWGGGHAPNVPAGTPLDCSGAVSKALGINPKVASQFESWGQAGTGKSITIYAKDTHVLMSIRGADGQQHFWGTSATNPGGGAGWIPKSAISPDYLKGFTARHPPGQ